MWNSAFTCFVSFCGLASVLLSSGLICLLVVFGLSWRLVCGDWLLRGFGFVVVAACLWFAGLWCFESHCADDSGF